MILINALGLSHAYAKKAVRPGDTAVDATCGKGRDTLLLAGLAGSEGRVYGFDIQEEAVASTDELLKKNGFVNSEVYCKCHSKMSQVITGKVSCVMFNLGYLPGTDHVVQTNGNTTVKAIKAAMGLLKLNGIITIVIYQGGDTGFEERDMVLDFCANINQTEFTVQKTSFENQKNNPPIFICIEKIS